MKTTFSKSSSFFQQSSDLKDEAGNWTEIVAIIPRTYWATEIIDLSSYLSNSMEEFKVRLYFTDSHKVDFVGLDTTAQTEIDVEQALLLLAYHSEDGIVTSKLRTDDDVYAELTPGQQITLLFITTTWSTIQVKWLILAKILGIMAVKATIGTITMGLIWIVTV